MTGPVVTTKPTQIRHPWRAMLRTAFAILVGVLPVIPQILAGANLNNTEFGLQVGAYAVTVTRILALPAVDAWMKRNVSWLATSPPPPEPVRQ
jgi:hypothetical protein